MFWDNWFKRNKGNVMEITEEMHPDIDEMLTAEAEGIMVWNETSNEFLMTTAKGRSSSSMNSGVDLPGGVKVSSSKAKAGETLTIRYNGLLAQCGADSVYVHSGYGDLLWNDVKDIPMSEEIPGTWKAAVGVDPSCGPRVNFCFKDSADNWDNNYGYNWNVDITY